MQDACDSESLLVACSQTVAQNIVESKQDESTLGLQITLNAYLKSLS